MKNAVNPYVIDAKLSLPVRTRDFILTAAVWGFYLYFMRGFFGFLQEFMSWASIGFTHPEFYPTFKSVSTFGTYGLIVIALVMAFVGWSGYNLFRFGGKNRRKFPKPVGAEDLVIAYHNKLRDITAWQQSRIMIMHLDNAARLTNVEIVSRDDENKAA